MMKTLLQIYVASTKSPIFWGC